ncbi:MAG: CRISPR-associated endonuclease Cas2 [Gammaproteobacteria bacterium]|nr:CRISPR-associated endonuclease Cas2 [Gammaproteobacteria bacterium]
MSERDLYLLAYDVTDDRRLRVSLALARQYATGGQKSVHECFMTSAERGDLLHDYGLVLNERTDRLLLLRLDPRSRTYALGTAEPPTNSGYFYVA